MSSVQSPAPSSASTVSVNWHWYLIHSEICGLHVTSATGTDGLRLCAAIDAGYIGSRPSVLRNAETNHNPWLAPGVGVRAFWQVLGVLFDLGTEVSFPLTRYKYSLDDYSGGAKTYSTTDVYQIQPVGWTFSFGAAYGLP